MGKITRNVTVAAFVAGAVLATGTTAQAGQVSAQQSNYQGCNLGYVCLYSYAGWNGGSPEHRYYDYGVYKLYDEYGVHRWFNNQTGGATTRLCINSDGTNCTSKLSSWAYWDIDLTPYNSIRLDPS
ncbi:hypothetical protein [Streptomyces sp. YIM B13518]|uniref:hypothetical protein n=1 Tax=Streptomyces sp. YIM B13518 TaxID=3366316 RepID=UPI0036D0B3C9